ncbi:ATP-binding cassette domain-containing protein [Jiangella anatolica]|uniref:Peptide ABC transporter ATP-binding protein n=1 Tax=Jiangella anatolica TaxID=2670374 RepID=A0A2W2C2J0_9ACTN|nr:ATP-binding cassette domain-containing protein [Jiangella anatolica]PZF82409.1 peptide ABC transporter ATP-binding protein [Jiangella anatolica]
MTERILEVRDLRVQFEGRRRGDRPVLAVDDVSLHVDDGETLGLVGESGSGKSTIGNAVLGLVRPTRGQVLFRGADITSVTSGQRRALGQQLQVIFQDPYSSLNPSRTIGSTLAEPLRIVRRASRRDAAAQVEHVLAQVGMATDTFHRFPREFSGGQRQRIAIARALVLGPKLIICDEPTSALDLSVQAQILNLLLDLQRRLGLSYLFVSHDIDVIRHMSHRVAVLSKGSIVEQGPTDEVTGSPSHAYTRALLAAVPVPDPRVRSV